MLTKTFALISWHLSIHVSPNNLILQPWNIYLWTGEGSPKPVKTSISSGQASRISLLFDFSYLWFVSPPPSPNVPSVVSEVEELCLCTCSSLLGHPEFISIDSVFLRLLRLVCCHLNFWDFFPPLGGTLMIIPHTPDQCRGNSAPSLANTATLLLPAACRSRSQLGSPTTSGTVPRLPVQAGSSAPL